MVKLRWPKNKSIHRSMFIIIFCSCSLTPITIKVVTIFANMSFPLHDLFSPSVCNLNMPHTVPAMLTVSEQNWRAVLRQQLMENKLLMVSALFIGTQSSCNLQNVILFQAYTKFFLYAKRRKKNRQRSHYSGTTSPSNLNFSGTKIVSQKIGILRTCTKDCSSRAANIYLYRPLSGGE